MVDPIMRAMMLLRENLSPSQLSQYDKEMMFEVVGSHGGEYIVGPANGVVLRRRLKPGFFEWLLRKKTRLQRYCVTMVTDDHLFYPPADLLLTLKLVLENDEREVLEIAGRLGIE